MSFAWMRNNLSDEDRKWMDTCNFFYVFEFSFDSKGYIGITGCVRKNYGKTWAENREWLDKGWDCKGIGNG